MSFNKEQIDLSLAQADIDVLVGTTKENVQYFSGFAPVIKTLNPYHGQCYIMLHRRDLDNIHIVHSVGEIDQILDADIPVQHVQTYGLFYREYSNDITLLPKEQCLLDLSQPGNAVPTPPIAAERLINILQRQHGVIRRIGYDEDGMSRQTLCHLKQSFPAIEFVEAAALIRYARRRKTPYEVACLEASAKINEAAVYDAIAQIREGMTEIELVALFNLSLVKRGAYPSLSMVKIGRAAAGGQMRQRENICLQPGDMLWFDADAVYQGFWSDIARVHAFENVEAKTRTRYHALQNGMRAAFDYSRPGRTGREVFNYVMDVVHRSGFPEYRRHHVGHAIGLEPYEMPILSPSDENIIEEGMVLSIETPYYELGIGALHIEDPVHIGKDSNRFLTARPVPDLNL